MKEKDYIAATNIAKIRAAKVILRDVHASENTAIQEQERAHVLKCLGAWEARLEREVSPETKRENKEPWRTKFPIDLPKESS